MNEPAAKPPCASWKVWTGQEIEGTSELGETTLFIRELPGLDTPDKLTAEMAARLTRAGKIKRVWFCVEYTNWEMIRAIKAHFVSACLEVNVKTFYNIPPALLREIRIYYKVPVKLKDGDFVCVGPAFSDESFEIGKGSKVTPDQYLKDRKIL